MLSVSVIWRIAAAVSLLALAGTEDIPSAAAVEAFKGLECHSATPTTHPWIDRVRSDFDLASNDL